MPLDDVIDDARAAYLAESGINRLRELAETLRVAQDADERDELLTAFARDELAVDEVAVALVIREHDAERELIALRGSLGAAVYTQLAKVLRRRARAMEARRKGFRVAGEDEVLSVREALGAPEDWPGYPVPAGWQPSRTGVVLLGEAPVVVAHEPVMVRGLRVDVVTGQEHLVLGHRRLGAWRELVVPREQARDSRGIAPLAAHGLPVSSNTARDLVRWVEACEASAGGDLEIRQCTARTGWHDEVYVSGPGGVYDLDDPDGARVGWTPSGTWEGFLEALEVVEAEPVPWLVLYAAALAPLLRWLDLGHCPIVDLSGPRGRGKTTCLRLAGACFGRPDEAVGGTLLTWDSSPTSLERMAARSWDVPLLIDDTMRARRASDVTSALYSLAQGRGRGRGTPGGIQRTSTWRTVVVSTGEAPLVEATEAGGARARVLSITTTPAIGALRTAKRLEALISVHHGHLGTRVAARGLELGFELKTRHRQALERWARDVPADTRLLSTVAALEVAAEVLVEIGVPRPQCDWRASLAEALTGSVEAADQSERALDLVRAEVSMRPGSYLLRARQEGRDPSGGWRGVRGRDVDGWIGLYPPTLREILEGAGHLLPPLLARWTEDGTLICNHGSQMEFKVDGQRHRVYAFRTDRLT